jgi:hypothetical protein
MEREGEGASGKDMERERGCLKKREERGSERELQGSREAERGREK